MPSLELVREFWAYAKERKKFWLVPMLVIILLLAVLIVTTESTAVAPLIYAIF